MPVIHFDCRHFRGHIPCKPNKLRGRECDGCPEYERPAKRILIIKLGAIGDVIRTSPLAVRYRELYPTAHITWITLSPDVVPRALVDEVYPYDLTSVERVRNTAFDIAINLDKEVEACALLRDAQSTEKFGFTLREGHIDAATPAAVHKLVTGLFDGRSKANTKNYLEEIFEVCHLDFKGEPYVLDTAPALVAKWAVMREMAAGKPIVGLNTGCGDRWKTRLWPEERWTALIRGLQAQGYWPVVLGGKQEDALNKAYSEATGCYYPGHFSLPEFFAVTANTDIIVTQVSMMMHIAIALKKRLVLFNNIFNPHEFELYGRGVIVQPTSGCDDYYGNTCTRAHHCMLDIEVDTVLGHIRAQAQVPA
ncbi:MAG TPA: glycosyltransferase family 9 protein [Flavobacteriales bacterium]|nr:glycosyltransferase family 9 protein [Flavobacteriales bacterium]